MMTNVLAIVCILPTVLPRSEMAIKTPFFCETFDCFDKFKFL